MDWSSRLLLIACLPAAAWAWVLTAAAAAPSPGCATTARCGDIDVPYPFSLDPRCAIHAGFWLNCTTEDGGATTKLLDKNSEVTRIFVEDGKAWFKNLVSRQCYNQTSGSMFYDNACVNYAGEPYVLSVDDNKIVVLGCNSMADMQSDFCIVGFMSTCNEEEPPKNGTCSRTAGCCEAELPRGVQYYQGFFNELYNTTQIWRGDALQLHHRDGERRLQLQHHLPHLDGVLRRGRLEDSRRDGMGDY